MFKEPPRAKRIRNRERQIAKAVKVAKRIDPTPGWSLEWIDDDGTERRLDNWEDLHAWHRRWARHNYNNLTVCSCYMCGNPRKFANAETKQEWISDIDAIDQYEDVGMRFISRFRSNW